jgi:hypothetical protein
MKLAPLPEDPAPECLYGGLLTSPRTHTVNTKLQKQLYSNKKTTESFYLTVEQVRQAASTWVEAQPLLPRDRITRYRHTANVIAYYQSHNREARIGIPKRRFSSCNG